jgi:hypothetical protein
MLDSTSSFLPEPIYKQKSAGIKIATPDILLDTDRLSINTMQEYTFATIGGIELLSASRHDLIDSPLNKEYTPVVDAGTRFSSTKEISVTDGSANIFGSFEIDISKHIVYDSANTVSVVDGNIVIQLKNLKSNYYVEVEVFSDVSPINVII